MEPVAEASRNSAKRVIGSVRSRPVAGWTSRSARPARTIRILSRGTPSPTAISGQTARNSTCGLIASIRSSPIATPSYRHAAKPRQRLTNTTGLAKVLAAISKG